MNYVRVYHYPRGSWDHLPEPATPRNAHRYFDWKDNPISRAFLAGPATEPYEILAAYLRGGPKAAQRVMEQRGVRVY